MPGLGQLPAEHLAHPLPPLHTLKVFLLRPTYVPLTSSLVRWVEFVDSAVNVRQPLVHFKLLLKARLRVCPLLPQILIL